MGILSLLEDLGIRPKLVAATHGGEYHSSCPGCGGKDRFCVWPKASGNGRYWCRGCGKFGDAIQFCKDFMSLSYADSCQKLGLELRAPVRSVHSRASFSPCARPRPDERWSRKADEFINECHAYLCEHPELLNYEKDRGLSWQSIQDFKLGWNVSSKFESRELWGLPLVDGASNMQMCLPEGIVISYYREDSLRFVKIRRTGCFLDGGLSKYHILAGSKICPAIYKGKMNSVVIVEAELDAMLIRQLAGDLCSCVALGGVSNRPDDVLHALLQDATRVLYALDFDEAGKKAFVYWKSAYPNVVPWPVPVGKSPGDACSLGVDIRGWVVAGLAHGA